MGVEDREVGGVWLWGCGFVEMGEECGWVEWFGVFGGGGGMWESGIEGFDRGRV